MGLIRLIVGWTVLLLLALYVLQQPEPWACIVFVLTLLAIALLDN